MNFAEFSQLDRADTCYLYVLCKMRIYGLNLQKISLSRRKNKSGRLISDITAHLYDNRGNFHPMRFKLYDETYIWFFSHFSADFPETPFEDLSPDEFKLNKEG